MDVKKYFDRVTKKVDNMNDKEFMDLLKRAGIDNCPLSDEAKGKYQLNSKNKSNNSYSYRYNRENNISTSSSEAKNSNLLRAS